jgi:hypothetical protein
MSPRQHRDRRGERAVVTIKAIYLEHVLAVARLRTASDGRRRPSGRRPNIQIIGGVTGDALSPRTWQGVLVDAVERRPGSHGTHWYATTAPARSSLTTQLRCAPLTARPSGYSHAPIAVARAITVAGSNGTVTSKHRSWLLRRLASYALGIDLLSSLRSLGLASTGVSRLRPFSFHVLNVTDASSSATVDQPRARPLTVTATTGVPVRSVIQQPEKQLCTQ